jgi:hypothetical protein
MAGLSTLTSWSISFFILFRPSWVIKEIFDIANSPDLIKQKRIPVSGLFVHVKIKIFIKTSKQRQFNAVLKILPW